MALLQKFRDAVSGAGLNVSALDMNRSYPLVYCERVETKYGPAVCLAVREEDANIVKVFLPRRYGDTFTDEDVSAINERSVQYYLSYKGKSLASKSAILQIDV